MKKIILLVLVALFVSGCGAPQEKGLSMQDAIVIEADNEDMGVGMEYDWLQINGCPNNSGVINVEMQELDYDAAGGIYDVLYVICNDKTEKKYYFNIDSFFGKWE